MFQHEIDALPEEERKDYLRHNYIARSVPDKIKHDKKYKGAWREHIALAFGYEDVEAVKKRIDNLKRQRRRRTAKPKPTAKTKRTSR